MEATYVDVPEASDQLTI